MPQAEGTEGEDIGSGNKAMGVGKEQWEWEWDTGSGRQRILETDYIYYLLVNIKQTALQHQ